MTVKPSKSNHTIKQAFDYLLTRYHFDINNILLNFQNSNHTRLYPPTTIVVELWSLCGTPRRKILNKRRGQALDVEMQILRILFREFESIYTFRSQDVDYSDFLKLNFSSFPKIHRRVFWIFQSTPHAKRNIDKTRQTSSSRKDKRTDINVF